jgi:adenylate cyclase
MFVDLATQPFRLGEVTVNPSSNEIAGARIDGKAMDVLVCLARAAPEVVRHAELLDGVWPHVRTGDNVLHQAIAQLRRVLSDSARAPRFIETIPRRGYRLLIQPCPAAGAESGDDLPVAAEQRRHRQIASSRVPVLAVLPFDNLCEDTALQYFSDGISEEILQTVSRTRRLRVIGRSSSFQFRGAAKSVRHVARELKASHVLDGSVRRSGERVRIAAQLIDCASQTTLWSHRFESELGDIFQLQDQIARAVAQALQLAFEPSVRTSPIDPVAFDLYLRARTGAPSYLGGQNLDMLEAAVAREPQLASAWAALALSWAIEAQDAGPATSPLPAAKVKQLRHRARQAAERALERDPSAALAHAALAALEPICGAYAAAQGHLARALGASPDDPTVLLRVARWRHSIGRVTDALALLTRAYDLDPLNPAVANDLGTTLYVLDRNPEAHVILDINRQRWPEIDYVVQNPLNLAAFWQEWDRVERMVADVRARGPHSAKVSGHVDHLASVRREGTRVGEQQTAQLRRQLAETGTVSLSLVAQAGFLGDADAVYQLLGRASFDHLFKPAGRLLAGDYGTRWLFGSVRGPMQRDRRFSHLCARLGLCAYWIETGEWPDCAESVSEHYDFPAEARRAVACVPAPAKK